MTIMSLSFLNIITVDINLKIYAREKISAFSLLNPALMMRPAVKSLKWSNKSLRPRFVASPRAIKRRMRCVNFGETVGK